MLLLTGENTVTANVSGPVENYVTADVAIVIFYLPDLSFKSWSPAGNNDLLELIAGQEYKVIVTADVDLPAFSSNANNSVSEIKTTILRGESIDGATSNLPAIEVKNSSLNLVKIIYSAINDDYTIKSAGEYNYLINVDDTGAVSVVDSSQLYQYNVDLSLAIDTDTNKIIAQVTNEGIGFTGLTRWALKIELTTIVYPIPL